MQGFNVDLNTSITSNAYNNENRTDNWLKIIITQ